MRFWWTLFALMSIFCSASGIYYFAKDGTALSLIFAALAIIFYYILLRIEKKGEAK